MTRAELVRRVPAFAVGAVFLVAGALKAADVTGFARLVAGYRLLPESSIAIVAVWLPWTEVLAGALLLGWRYVAGAAAVATALAAVFLLAGLTALARGLAPDCGCFGVHSGPIGLATIALEVAVLVGAVGAWRLGGRSSELRVER